VFIFETAHVHFCFANAPHHGSRHVKMKRGRESDDKEQRKGTLSNANVDTLDDDKVSHVVVSTTVSFTHL